MEELNFNNNNDDEYFDLETLITEGTEARVPIKIEFPNGKKAKALIRPVLAEDLKIIGFNFDNPFAVMTEVLKISLLKSNGESLPAKLVDALPAGLPIKIAQQIFEISGIETNPEDAGQLQEDLESFLESR